ncbi:winged helix-turn-helix transcriptional regulator [Devosia sp.]|uniref:winged helix-turn-helix transcriptional regulator n=1 Tax=Devosia sp. TaxID=1871048 RepID=UPI002FCB87F3
MCAIAVAAQERRNLGPSQMLVPTPPPQLGTLPACREVNQMLGRMGDKWTIMTIAMLVQRPTRFNELKRMIGGISQQMLTRTLRSLEGDGLVLRKVHPSVPPQVEYSLTPLGQSLAQPLLALGTWVMDNMGAIQSHREQIGTPPVTSR